MIPEEESKIDHWKKNSSALNESIKEDSETCCSCKKTSITEDDTEVEKRIDFEDYLINSIFNKRYYNVIIFSHNLWKGLIYFWFDRSTNESLQRKKREIPDTQPQQSLELLTQSEVNTTSQIPTTPPLHVYFKHIVHKEKSVLISNLSHFTEYTIEVRACHDSKPDPERDNCSLNAITSVRTLPLG